jgi:hypothetical protein
VDGEYRLYRDRIAARILAQAALSARDHPLRLLAFHAVPSKPGRRLTGPLEVSVAVLADRVREGRLPAGDAAAAAWLLSRDLGVGGGGMILGAALTLAARNGIDLADVSLLFRLTSATVGRALSPR